MKTAQEKRREWRRKYRAANRLKLNEQERKYHAANREKQRASQRKYNTANREKVRERHRRRRGQPAPMRPCPEFCEWPGCVRKATHLDHCHATEVFRGWLCLQHNSGLGLIGDTRETLQAGVDYLKRAESEAWLAIPGDGLPIRRKIK